MPSARAIRYKSGPATSIALRAFRFYPYCFPNTASAHIVRPLVPPTFKARQLVPLPTARRGTGQPVVDDEE